MRLIRRSSLWGTVIFILISTTICMYFYMNNKYIELENYNKALCATINEQTNTINNLENEKGTLNTYISQLEQENSQLQLEKDKIQEQVQVQVSQKESTPHKDFKSYMPYTAITDKTSKQWELQKSASSDENGIRCIDGRPMVAVGTGWGLFVGDVALITCENGNSFEVVIGDIKDNAHTNSDNKTTLSNNCRCEFIVDMGKLNPIVKNSGNVAALEKYNGYVTNVQKIG